MELEINDTVFTVINLILPVLVFIYYKFNQRSEKVEIINDQKTSDEPLTLLVFVFKSAKIQKGKICAQVGHAISSAWFDKSEKIQIWKQSECKIEFFYVEDVQQFLEVTKLIPGISSDYVQDAGHTQCAPGTETVGWMGPVNAEQLEKFQDLEKVE